jgi:hypothetical protein
VTEEEATEKAQGECQSGIRFVCRDLSGMCYVVGTHPTTLIADCPLDHEILAIVLTSGIVIKVSEEDRRA